MLPLQRPRHSGIEVLPDPARRWLLTQKPEGFRGWWPATGAQEAALNCPADILMLGGTLGSLKTSTILVDLIAERDSPRMVSYFFRQSYPSLEDAIRQSSMLFPNTGARYNGQDHSWRWPSGAIFRFRQCKNDRELYDNFGKELSAIGIDQSEQFPEDYVRFLISRNRSVDSGLKIRVRLGANPGGEGGQWHMKVFFNGVCPHCEPEKAPPQGLLRTDAMWPSDNVKIDLTVSYILSSVREHNLLGADYIKRVQMQHPATAKALLDGCWKTFEGQYYDIWNPDIHVMKRQEFQDQWYLAHWIGADYGYSGSAAAAGLFCRTEPIYPRWPNGRVVLLDEYPSETSGARREPIRLFTQKVYEKFIKKGGRDEQAKRIEGMYLSPDSWNDRGDLHPLAEQMNEVLAPYGVAWERAHDDPAGAAQLAYAMLQSEEFVVCDSCPNTIAAFESRLKNPKEPVKVLKVPTDALDDYFDAIVRHGLYSYHQVMMKPAQMRIDERVQEIWKHDPMQAMMHSQQIVYEETNRGGPRGAYYGGNIRQKMAEEAQKGKRRF